MSTHPGSAAPPAPRSAHSARRAPLIISLVVVLLAGGALAFYVSRGAGMRDQALAAYAAGDCATVAAIAGDLGRQYALPGLSFVADAAPAVASCSAVESAGALAQARDHAAAVAAYDAFLADQSASPLAPRASAERVEAVFAWAAAQRDAGQHPEAIKTYALLARDDATLAARADEAAAATYVAWGEADLAAGNHGDAIARWGTIIADYPATSAATTAPAAIVAAYAGWTSELLAAGSYEELLDVYKQELDWAEGRGDEELRVATRLGQAGALLAWSEALQTEGDFSGAWARNLAAVEADPSPGVADGPAARASAAQPALLRAWAAGLVADGKPDQALAKLGEARALIPAADTATLAAVDGEITQAHLAIAARYTRAERFAKALEALDTAAAGATGAAAEAIEAQRVATLDAFARSDGLEAKKALTAAIGAMCGSGTLPALPAFALSDGAARIGLFTGDNRGGYKLPIQLAARSPAELHYVACASSESRVVESCAYNVGYTVERRRSYLTVALHAVPSGRVVETRTFSGPVPEDCQYIETFTIGQRVKVKAGGLPDEAAVTTWLGGFTK